MFAGYVTLIDFLFYYSCVPWIFYIKWIVFYNSVHASIVYFTLEGYVVLRMCVLSAIILKRLLQIWRH